MLRSLLCAVFALALCVVTVMAGEYKGVITKVEGEKITVKVEGEEKTFTLSDTVQITAGKKDIQAAGLGKRLEKAKKGVPATVVTEGSGASEKVVKITLGGGKKKKKDS